MKHIRTLPIVAWALTVLVGLNPLAADTVRALEPSSEPIHVRVQFKTEPAHQAVVSWTTTAEGESHQLYVDTEPREGDFDAYEMVLPSIHSQPYSLRSDEEAAGMDAYTHNVFLEGLEPATRYYLTAVSDGEQSQEYYFITAPDDDREIKLLLVGDSRVGDARTHSMNNRRRVNALMRDLLEQHPEIVAMAHGADYTNRAYWSELYWWLKDHVEKTTTSDGRLLPIIPSRGNHDLDVGFEEMFWWPERQNDYYYTTMLSPEVAFITLNTEISRGGDQRAWLESQLEELRPRVRWLTGQWHRPAWPSVRDFAGAAPQREAWVPLFERYELDLGYEAHDHALKRTYPIYNNAIDEARGVVYIGDGGGGVPQRRPDPSRWYLEVTGRHHHAHLLTFSENGLHGVAIDIDHNIVDEFVIDGGLRLLAGLLGPDAFTQHLATLLGDPREGVREAGQAILGEFIEHHDLGRPREREAFLSRMQDVFADVEGGSGDKRRIAYQILLLHADHENGEAQALLRQGMNDPAAEVREFALIVDQVDLSGATGRAIILQLDTRQAVELREAAFREVMSETADAPRAAFPDDRDEAEFEQVDAFELPIEGWKFHKDQSRTGYFNGWFQQDVDTSDWMDVEIGDFWASFLDEMYIGAGWYRAVIDMPAMSEHDALGLHFNGVDEEAWVWIDGEYVGQHTTDSEGLSVDQLWDRPFQFDVTDMITPGEAHQLTIRVQNSAVNGGIWEAVELRAFREVR